MYHYVRPIQNSEFKNIKGLEIEGFERQIKFFKDKFGFADVNYVFDGINSGDSFDGTPVILTFDDGLKDHYRYVFPLLKTHKIQGLFFPPAKPIMENIVLDVHKIHFILANINDESKIVKEVFEQINFYRKNFEIEKPEELWEKLSIPGKYDSKEIIFVKRVLQRELPQKVRSLIINYLFEKYVASDESEFSKKLYLSLEEIDEMRESGMYFSSHSYAHEWLSHLSVQNLELELEKSVEFCNRINPNGKQMMCYPYGDYNDLVKSKINEYGFEAGITVKVGDAVLTKENAFELKRYDTNDFRQ